MLVHNAVDSSNLPFFHENRSLMCYITQASDNMWAVFRPIRIIVVEVCSTTTQLEGGKNIREIANPKENIFQMKYMCTISFSSYSKKCWLAVVELL